MNQNSAVTGFASKSIFDLQSIIFEFLVGDQMTIGLTEANEVAVANNEGRLHIRAVVARRYINVPTR